MNKDLNKKCNAFTLAEVLITLGIIGVVSALTIPTLIKKYQEKVTVTKLKQSYSMLAQAFQMAVNENGPVTSWDLGTGMSDPQSHINLANYLKPYLKLNADCVGKGDTYSRKYCYEKASSVSHQYVVLSNNLIIQFRLVNPKCNYNNNTCAWLSVFEKNPKSGINSFVFDLNKNGIIPRGMADATLIKFETHCDPSVNSTLNGHSPMTGCTAWVIYNGNMDYLRCFDKLSWDGAHSCKEAEEKEN